MSNQFRRQVLKRTALAVVLGACLANGAVYAQSTTGSIYGSAPSEAGSTIVVQSDTGLSRTITVDANGRYNLGSLPVGAYTVTLKRGDQVVDTRKTCSCASVPAPKCRLRMPAAQVLPTPRRSAQSR